MISFSVEMAGIGVATPLGLNAATADAAFRAGIFPAMETETLGSDGEPIRAVRVSLLPSESERHVRMVALASWALTDLGQQPAPFSSETNFSAFIGLPDTHDEASTASLTALLRNRWAGVSPVFISKGRASFFFALQAAVSALSEGSENFVLVGCVDSQCSPTTLRYLNFQRRTITDSLEGIIPGEGAAFFWIGRPTLRGVLGRCLQTQTAFESRHFRQSEPNLASGLSAVFRSLRKDEKRHADLFYTCETGESFWSQELSNALLRNMPLMPEPMTRRMAADSFGDMGAAAGAVMTAIGTLALNKLETNALPPLLLVHGSSDDGHVGACLIEAGING